MPKSGLPALAGLMLAPLLMTSCLLDSDRAEFIGSTSTTTKTVIGFLGDSSVVVHRLHKREDRFDDNGYTDSRLYTLSSKAVSYNYVTGIYGDSVEVMPDGEKGMRGTSLYHFAEGSLQVYDFATKSKSVNRTSAYSLTGISADNEVEQKCLPASIELKRVKDGTVLYTAARTTSDYYSCPVYNIMAADGGWVLFLGAYGGFDYTKIKPGADAVSGHDGNYIDGHVFVHGLGSVPVTSTGFGSVQVPAFLDPDGSLTAGISSIEPVSLRYATIANLESKRYIYYGNLYEFSGTMIELK
jgi:hypothetical protein